MISYEVLEIFDSYQGEGVLLGERATFIRLAGCNLCCPWCDTDLTATPITMSINQIVEKIHSPLVVFTGGEPTLQNIDPLIRAIKHIAPIRVAIETNGTNEVPDNVDWIACSPKYENDYKIHELLRYRVNEYKYIVDEHFDAKYIAITNKKVWLQPQFYDMENSVKHIDEILSSRDAKPNWFFGIQAHKYWGLR